MPLRGVEIRKLGTPENIIAAIGTIVVIAYAVVVWWVVWMVLDAGVLEQIGG